MNLIKHAWGWGLVLNSLCMSSLAAQPRPAGVSDAASNPVNHRSTSSSGSAYSLKTESFKATPQTPQERFQISVARRSYLGPIDAGRIFTNNLDSVDKIIIYQIDPEQRNNRVGRYISLQIPATTLLGYKLDHPLLSANYRVAHHKEITGVVAQQIINAWKSQDIQCHAAQKECVFQPSYVIEFFSNRNLVLETYICFQCQTFVATRAGGHTGMCELEPYEGSPRKFYDKLNEVMGVSEPKQLRFAEPRPPLDAVESRWESENVDKLFTPWERDRIRAHINALVHYCASYLPGTQDRPSVNIPETSVHFTITDQAPISSQAPTNPQDNVLGSAVADIAVTTTSGDKALNACVEKLLGKLRFLPSQHGPLPLGIRVAGHVHPPSSGQK